MRCASLLDRRSDGPHASMLLAARCDWITNKSAPTFLCQVVPHARDFASQLVLGALGQAATGLDHALNLGNLVAGVDGASTPVVIVYIGSQVRCQSSVLAFDSLLADSKMLRHVPTSLLTADWEQDELIDA